MSPAPLIVRAKLPAGGFKIRAELAALGCDYPVLLENFTEIRKFLRTRLAKFAARGIIWNEIYIEIPTADELRETNGTIVRIVDPVEHYILQSHAVMGLGGVVSRCRQNLRNRIPSVYRNELAPQLIVRSVQAYRQGARRFQNRVFVYFRDNSSR